VIQGRSVAAILFVWACATVSGFLAGTVAMYLISRWFYLTPMLPRIEILGSMVTAIVCFGLLFLAFNATEVTFGTFLPLLLSALRLCFCPSPAGIG
jgi:hypothetical protein